MERGIPYVIVVTAAGRFKWILETLKLLWIAIKVFFFCGKNNVCKNSQQINRKKLD